MYLTLWTWDQQYIVVITSHERRHTIFSCSKCYFDLKSKSISTENKRKLYKTVMCPVVTYGAETRAINKSDEKTLMTCKRWILRKIFSPVM